jgi:microcystin-dependent protein
MGSPYVGEIRMVGFNFAPQGWSLCNGQTISIAQNEVLFDLIGTTYGGDGQTTYNLPDLQGRAPIHQGTNSGTPYVMGQRAGVETVTLTQGQLPAHTHQAAATTGATSVDPTGKLWSTDPNGNVAAYNTAGSGQNLLAAAISITGSSLPHENIQPFQVINFVISLFGIFPTQN